MFLWQWVPHAEAQHDDADATSPYWIHPARGKYVLQTRHYLEQAGRVTAAAFYAPQGLLAVGLSTGVFMLLELPSRTVLQTFRYECKRGVPRGPCVRVCVRMLMQASAHMRAYMRAQVIHGHMYARIVLHVAHTI